MKKILKVSGSLNRRCNNSAGTGLQSCFPLSPEPASRSVFVAMVCSSAYQATSSLAGITQNESTNLHRGKKPRKRHFVVFRLRQRHSKNTARQPSYSCHWSEQLCLKPGFKRRNSGKIRSSFGIGSVLTERWHRQPWHPFRESCGDR